MTRITENIIESFTIELLEKLGYKYIYAPDIAPDSENPERESFEQVFLLDRLQTVERGIGLINGGKLLDNLTDHWNSISEEFRKKRSLKIGLVHT